MLYKCASVKASIMNKLAVCTAVPVSILVAIGIIRKIRNHQWGKCRSSHSLRGKTFLITGANSGIGLETARALVGRKARVIFACRNLDSAKKVIAEIRKAQPTGGEMIPMQLDLASFDSIRSFAEVVKHGFPKIDVLINNAGVYIPLQNNVETKDGFEAHFGVNHLGHFLLTDLLLDLLKKASPSRVVVVSSTLFQSGQIDFTDLNLKNARQNLKKNSRKNPGYANSKLMNVYFARSLSNRLKDHAVDVHAVCPGFTLTNLFRHSLRWYHYIFMFPIALFYLRSAEKGSQTVLHCATELSLEGTTGGFYRDCKLFDTKFEFDLETENKLWEISEELTKAKSR